MVGARPAVKICGVCRDGDATLVSASGADYIGVILAPGRGRTRSPEEAESIFDLAEGCRRVGVFVDPPIDEVWSLAERLELDVVQLHGEESPSVLSELGRGPWRLWKALRPRRALEFLEGLELYAPVADAILLDGWSEDAPGGTGSAFPWSEIEGVRGEIPAGLELIIAGGLHPGNLSEARERLDPDVVDVSSGVEVAPGVKGPWLVQAFVAAARGEDGC